jgi:hypothetical protein
VCFKLQESLRELLAHAKGGLLLCAAVISMGLHPTSAEINELLLNVGADDRLIQLDEFEMVGAPVRVSLKAMHRVSMPLAIAGDLVVYEGQGSCLAERRRRSQSPTSPGCVCPPVI